MNKQTAVQLLVSKLNKEGFAPVLTNEEIQQALQMEREQIVEAHIYGQIAPISTIKIHDAEQYYNEIYGNHFVDANEMIDHNGDVNEMVGGQDESK